MKPPVVRFKNSWPGNLFERYLENPMTAENEVRLYFRLPEDRYFTVSTWPPNLAGQLFVDNSRTRVVQHYKKVSKSSQST